MEFELADSPWLLPALGLLVGIVIGCVARWNHFCTLTSLERYWYANDSRGIRTWALACAVALFSTQVLIAFGFIELNESFYLIPRLSLIGAIIGGLLFGLGMSLVGTCGFGALIRLGSGSLRSLIIVAGMGLAALTAQRGFIGQFRQSTVEPLSISLKSENQSLAGIVQQLTGYSLALPIALLISFSLLFWIFRAREYRTDFRGIFTGSVIGLCVTAGWLITYSLNNIMFRQVQVESASFVLPPGEVIFHFIAVTNSIPDYGVGMVIGVVLGASIVSVLSRDVHWEACDDPRELGRHLFGAFLMGTGGVFAAGCTVGQGISAFSTMAISAPIVMLSIVVGARIGLQLLLEGIPQFTLRSAR